MIGGDVLHAMAQSYIFDAHISDSTKILLLRTMNEAMLDVAWGRYKQFLSDSMSIADVSLEYILEYNLWQVTGSYTFLFPLRFGYVLIHDTMEVDPLMIELCRYVGILFQTGDDVIGLFGDPAVSGKSNHGDIIQGKKTIPIYFAYHHANVEQKSLLDALVGKQDLTDDEAELVKSIVTEHGLSPTKECMQNYAEISLEVIEQLSYSDAYKQWWKELVGYLMKREV
jgi:geranylgeranyl diphosphate synthase type I